MLSIRACKYGLSNKGCLRRLDSNYTYTVIGRKVTTRQRDGVGRLQRQAGQCQQRRLKSKSSKEQVNANVVQSKPKDDLLLKQSAEDMTALFEIDSKRGMEIASHMSKSARNELSLLRKKLLSEEGALLSGQKVSEPSRSDLRIHALTSGLPFIGFGICDNAILIWCGDLIDTKLGFLFSISTLGAAAIGNTISNLAGLGCGAYIEDFCSRKLRLPQINLSNAQRQLRSVRMSAQIGNCIGITIGCIIGMFPLLLIHAEVNPKHKMDQKDD